jgi:hypothetical protein
MKEFFDARNENSNARTTPSIYRWWSTISNKLSKVDANGDLLSWLDFPVVEPTHTSSSPRLRIDVCIYLDLFQKKIRRYSFFISDVPVNSEIQDAHRDRVCVHLHKGECTCVFSVRVVLCSKKIV